MSYMYFLWSICLVLPFQPEPGLTSRPDRLLVSRDLTPAQVSLQGAGAAYGARRSREVWWHRAWQALQAASDSYHGKSGFSCLHDCGPHGVCRCGVCVSKGDKDHSDSDRCLLPDCAECSASVHLQLCGFAAVLTVVMVLAGMAAVKVGKNTPPYFIFAFYFCLLGLFVF